MGSENWNYITSNGAYLGDYSSFEIYGGYWVLGDSLSVRYFNFYGNYLDMAGQAIYASQSFYTSGGSFNYLDMTNSRIHTRNFYGSSQTYYTTGSTIYLTDPNSNYFRGNSKTYGNLVVKGITEITGNNSFNRLTCLPGSNVTFEAFAYQYFAELIAAGEKNKEISFHSSSAGMQTSLYCVTSPLLNYVMAKDIYADGLIPFNATNSIDLSNNTNWVFTPPAGTAYYWVGNGGNWSNLSHWSGTSGGAANKSEPPSKYDNVYFDHNSFTSTGQIVVIDTAFCRNLDLLDVTNSPTLSMNSYNDKLNINGSLRMGSNAIFDLREVYFISATDGELIIPNGNYPGVNSELYFNGEGSWTLTDSLSARYLNFTKGTFDFNGQAVNLGTNGYLSINGASTDTLDMSGATIYTRNFNDYSGTILITDSSAIHMVGLSNSYFAGNGKNFNDLVVHGRVTFEFYSNTFDTVTVYPGAEVILPPGYIQTVNYLNAVGSKFSLINIHSYTAGTQAELYSDYPANVEWAVIKDVFAWGSGAPFNAYNSTDNGNNTGWNFYAPSGTDYYWVGGTGNWEDPAEWVDSLGNPQTERPSIFDDVYFDENSFTAPGQVVTIDTLQACHSLDMIGVTYNPTLYMDANYGHLDVGGSFVLSPDASYSLNEVHFVSSEDGNIVDPWGRYMGDNASFRFEGSGSWNLTDSLSIPLIMVYNGNLDFGGQSVNLGQNGEIYLNGTPGDSINMSWSNIYCYYFYDQTGGTLITEGSAIYMVNPSYNYFQGYNERIYNDLIVDGYMNMGGNDYTFNVFEVLPGSEVRFPATRTQTIGELIANGLKTSEITLRSSSAGTPATLYQAGGTVSVEWVSLQDLTATGVTPFIADNSTDLGGNTGWTINAPVPGTYYWIGGSGTWSDLSHWSTTSGGTADQVYLPGRLDSVFFDASSYSADGTLTIDMDLKLGNLDMSALEDAVVMTNLNDYNLDVYGSLNLPENIVWEINNINFYSETPGNTLGNGDCLQGRSISFQGSGEYILTDSLSVNWFGIHNGTVDFNDQPVTAGYIYIEGSQPKNVYLRSSNIELNNYWNLSSNNVVLDAGTSTITINGGYFYANQYGLGALMYNNVVFRDYGYLYQSAIFNTISLQSVNYLYCQGGAVFTINDLQATGTSSDRVDLYSNNPSLQYTFSKAAGTVNISYATLQGSNATGGATFNAIESTDNGNNTGWNFIADVTPPEFAAGYPSFSDSTESGFILHVKMNEGGILYYVLMPDSSTAPTVSEVVNGTGAGGATPIQQGSFSINLANSDIIRQFSSLSTGTHYDLYVVAKDGASVPNLQAAVTLINVKTSGNVPPVFEPGYPVFTTIYESVANFSVRINEASWVYYGVLPAGSLAPTPAELKAGPSSVFHPVYWNYYNHDNPIWNYNYSVTGLTGATDYDLYFVAEDKATPRNLQTGVTLLSFTTAAYQPPVFTGGFPYIDNIQDNSFIIHVDLDEPSDVYYVVVPDGAAAPSVSQVLNGQNAGGTGAILAGMLDYNSYGGQASYTVYGTEMGTAYDIYLVAQDIQAVPNVQTAVIMLNLTTSSDTYAPLYSKEPEVANAFDQSVDMVTSLTEAGSVYFVIDTAGSSNPSSAQVFAGTTSTGGVPVTSGSFLVAEPFTQVIANLSGLAPQKGYRIFLAAQDDEVVPNRMNWIIARDFTTSREPRNYYWVGNSGNWSDPAHWVGTSGGSDHYSEPPSSVDNVFFDDNSFSLQGQQVTVNQTAYFNDMTWTNSPYKPVFHSNYQLNAYGSVTIPANIEVHMYNLYLIASDPGNVLALDFSGTGNDYLYYMYLTGYGSYTITDSSYYQTIYSYGGDLTFDAPASVGELRLYNSVNPRTITLNNIDLQVNNFGNYSQNAAKIVQNNSRMLISASFEVGQDEVYGTLVFNGNVYTAGSPLIDTLILVPGTTLYLHQNGTFTVNELIAQGTKTGLIGIRCSTVGMQSRIRKTSGTVDGKYLKITDNIALGGATFNALNSFDMGNNSGWNFTPPVFKEYYWVGGSGAWSDLSHWSDVSGGTPNQTELPFEYENVHFDQNSFDAPGIVSIDINVKVKTMDASGLDQMVTFQEAPGQNVDMYLYGSILLPPDYNWTVNPVHFSSDSAGNVIENGHNLNITAYFEGTGEYILSDSTRLTQLLLHSGSLDLNDQPLSVQNIYIETDNPRTLKMRSSNIYVEWYWYVNSNNLMLDAGTSVIRLDGGYFYADQNNQGPAYHDIYFSGNYVYYYNSASFNTINIASGTSMYFQGNRTVTFNELFAAGTQANKIYFRSNPDGYQYTFNKSTGTVNVYNAVIRDSKATGGAVFNAYESTDNGNNSGWNFLSDLTPPEFLPGYPLFRDSVETSFAMAVKVNEGGKVYYVLMPDSSVLPTVTEVVNGTGAGGATALSSGNLSITSVGIEYTKTFTGLTLDTPYDLYLVAQDDAASQNLQTNVTLLDVKTSGNLPPFFGAGYPQISTVLEDRVEVDIRLNEPSTVYLAVVARGATAPTPAQVRAGNLASFISQTNYYHYNTSLTYTRSLGGLTPASDYDMYIVAEDVAAFPNLQDSVTLLQFTTAPAMPPVFTAGYPYLDYIQNDRFNLYVSMDEPGRLYYVIVPDGAIAPSVGQVLLGQQADGSAAFLSGFYNFWSYGGSDGWMIRGTESLTSYDVYVVARDNQAVPNVQAFVTKLDLTTVADIYPPNYQVYPSVEFAYDNHVEVGMQLDEAGKAYYVVDTAGSAVPSVNQVFAGTNAGDGIPVTSGTFNISTGFMNVLGDITGLDPEKTYRIFIVVEDDEIIPNRITFVRSLDVTTTRTPRNYYWVGDGGIWSDVSHWATTSGGAGYWDTPPTAIDNVYFDENSFTLPDQTVTFSQNVFFKDMIWTNNTLQPKLQSNYGLIAYGSIIVPENIKFWVGSITLMAPDTGNVLSIDFTNNNGDNLSYIYMDAFGEYTVTDSFRMVGLEYYKGGMIINAPVGISLYRFYNSDVKSLTINVPELRFNEWIRYENTNLNLNAANTKFFINSYFHDEDDGSYPVVEFAGNASTWGSFSIDTLILKPGRILYMGEGYTLTINDLVAQGTKTSMIEIRSTSSGIQSSLYKSSGTIDVDYLKIRDNAAIGGATFNANNSLDLGNNTGWNFTPPASLDYYWTGGSGNWSDLGHWSHTSGGPSDHSELPGKFDNVYFDGNSFTGYFQQAYVDISPVDLHTLDMTGCRYDPSLSGWIDMNIYGSLILHDSVDFSVKYVYFMSDSAGNVIKDAGAGHYYTYYYFYGNGAWTFTDSVSVYQIYQTNGTLDFNDQPVKVEYFYSRYSAPRTLDMGASTVYLGYYWYVNGANLALDAGTSTIIADGAVFYPNNDGIPGLSYHDLNTKGAIYLYNSTSFNTLTLLPGTDLYLQTNTDFYVNNLVAVGTEAQPVYISSFSNGTQAGFVQASGTVTGYYLHIRDNVASGGATFNAWFSDASNSVGWNLMKATQTVTFDATTPVPYDPDGLKMFASASSGDVITFELVSGDGMVSNDTLYANVPDTFLVRAFQAGNAYYMPSDTVVRTYFITRLDQVITFDALADKDAADVPFTISATASSALPVNFSLTGPATISGNTITLTGETGIVEVTASQPGDAYYNAAAPVQQSFNVTSVAKTDQTITFDAIPDQTYGTAWIVLTATASSGLPVTFTLVSGPASVSADTVYLGATGTIEIMATQAGDADYNPAPSVNSTFVVNKAPQTITFTDIPDLTYGDDPYPLTAISSSGHIVTYKVNSGNASVILSQPNLIQNGNFDEVNPADSTAILWGGWGGPDNAPLPRIIDGVAVCTPIAADWVWKYQFSQSGLNASPNVDYIFMFKAWADAPRTFNVDFEDIPENNYQRFGSSTDPRSFVGISDWTFDITTEPAWYMFHVNFDKILGNTIQKVQFMLGTSSVVTYIDSVTLVRNYLLDIHGAGEVSVSAYQEGTSNFLAADPVTQVVTVAKSDQQIAFQTFENVLIDHDPIPLTSTATSGLPLTYWVTGPASVADDSIHLTGVSGVVWVYASQAGNVNYNPVTDSTTFTVTDPNKTDQTITFNTIADQPYSALWVVVSATATSGLPVEFAIESGPATVSNDTVYLTGPGTVTVNALQPGNASYNPAPKVSRTFTVSLTSQTISFNTIADQTYGIPWVVVSATATSGLPVEFAIESGPATVSNDTVYLTGAGTVKVNALQPGNTYYTAAPMVTNTFTVNKAGQTISFTNIPDMTYGDDPWPLEATASSGLPVTFKVNSGKAQVVSNELQITGAGTVVASAYQAGNSNFLAADSVTQTVLVAKASQQIVFQTFANVLINNPPITLTSTATSGLALAYTIKGPASLVSNTIQLTGAPGTVWVIANQAGNDDYLAAATDSTSFTVTDPGKSNQTISFTGIPNQSFNDRYVVAVATASSGLAVTLTIVSGPATVSVDTLYFTGTGAVEVRADQPGNGSYNPAASVTRTFSIAKGTQTIGFTNIPDMTFGDDPWPLEAVATSGLAVTFKVNSGKALVVSNELQLTGAGTVVVSAYQGGDANYLPADSVSQSVSVAKASQQILWQSFPAVTVSNPPITLTTSSTSGLPLVFSASGPASVTGTTLTLSGVSGEVTVFASHAGNADYLPVSDNKSFMVTDPDKLNQTITFGAIPDVEIGVGSLTLTASASSGLTVTYVIVSGPGSLSGNVITFTGTGAITVTAKQVGNTVYNPAPDVTRSFNVIENIACPDAVDFTDIKICEGDTARLSVTAEYGHSYYWIETGTTDTVSKTVVFEEYPVVTTDYIYKEVIDSTGCEVSDIYSVYVDPVPEFTFEVLTNPINPGNSSSITLTGASNYTFAPSGSVTKVTTGVYNLTPAENTIYIVTGISTEGCETEDMVEILVYCEDQCSDEILTDVAGSFDHGCDNRSYRNNANCTWTIYPSGQMTGIRIEFYADSFDILAGDFVKVYAGSDESGTLIGSYNNNNRPPVAITVPGTEAFIHFTSNSTEVGRGFQAEYSVLTGLGDVTDDYIKVYPNPNEGIFTLEMKNVIFPGAEAEIFSSLGQKIWNRKIEPVNGSVNEVIDLTGMPHGLYYLRIITREEVYYKTVILE
jgi:hypothetical protein